MVVTTKGTGSSEMFVTAFRLYGVTSQNTVIASPRVYCVTAFVCVILFSDCMVKTFHKKPHLNFPPLNHCYLAGQFILLRTLLSHTLCAYSK